MNYSELVEMLKNSINAYHFPIEHRSNNKAVVIVIDGITPIEVKVGEVPTLLLKISSYKTNLMDGYFESNEKIHFQKNNKIGSDGNYVLFYPMIKGLQKGKYQRYFLMVVYEDPTKESGEVSRLAKIVSTKVLKQPVQNIKMPMIMNELKSIGTIPELSIRFYTVNNEDSSVDVKYREYLQVCKLKKEKLQNFKDMPFETMQDLLSDTDNAENYSKRETFIHFGKKEYRIKREIINDAEATIKETAEKIFNASSAITQHQLDNKIHQTDFMVEKMTAVISNLYSLAIGKREELKILSDADKFGYKDPIVDAKISASVKYIEMVKKTLFSCYLILIFSIINALLSWICIRFYVCQFFIGIIIVLFLMIIAITASLIRRLLKQYKNDLTI